MLNRRVISIIWLLFCSFSVWAVQTPVSGSFKFIENLGQWDERVSYRAEIPNGGLFLEEGAFTYHMYEEGFFEMLHGHYEGKSGKEGFSYNGHGFKLNFEGYNKDVRLEGKNQLPEHYNYFNSNDRSAWREKVHPYTGVYYNDLYENVDLKIYNHRNTLKYDFFVKPGASPSDIRINFEGVKIKKSGEDLLIQSSVGEIREKAPVAYQYIGERKVEVPCKYKIVNGNTVVFQLPEGYDSENVLVIDPELIFSTYSGSHSNNFGYTATFDSEGFLYSGSTAFGPMYPTTMGAYDRNYNGGNVDIAISKYDTSGTFMVWSTYIGGSESELPHSLIVNSNDEVFVFGTSGSPDYPVTPGAYDTSFNNDIDPSSPHYKRFPGLGVTFPYGTDLIISRISKDGGTLMASTFVGGSKNDGLNSASIFYRPQQDYLRYNYADEVRGEIDIDAQNNIYIATCTNSDDFPMEGSGWQGAFGGGTLDGIVIKMDNSLSSIIWSSYVGGSHDDAIYSLALDSVGDIYVTGGTTSNDLPVTSSVYSSDNNGGRADGFITHLTSDGKSLLHSTYFGSEEYDQVYFIELDYSGNVYLYGQTEESDSTFIINAEYADPNSGLFLSKLTAALDSVYWSTVFGTGEGGPNLSPTAFLVDICNKIYLSGWGGATNDPTQQGVFDAYGNFWPTLHNNSKYTYNMPLTSDATQSSTDGSDFYLMVMEDDASAIHFATYFGGPVSTEHVDGGTSRFDRKGKIYQSVCAGCGGNSDFPIKPNPGAVSPVNNSSCNNAVFKFDFKLPNVIADFEEPPIVCTNTNITFRNKSLIQSATKFYWDFGDGETSDEKNPTHTFTEPGTYEIKLKLTDNATCNLEDSISRSVTVLSDTTFSLPPVDKCPGDKAQIGMKPRTDTVVSYLWYPSDGLSSVDIPNPIADPQTTTDYTLLISNGVCTDTISQTVRVPRVSLFTPDNVEVCAKNPVTSLTAYHGGTADKIIWSGSPLFRDTLNHPLTDSTIRVTPLLKENKYYVMAINEQGCKSYDTAIVRVLDVDLTASDDLVICYGDTIELKASASATEDISYTWSPASEIPGATDTSSVKVYPRQETTYTVTGENRIGCSETKKITVRVSQLLNNKIDAWADRDTIYDGEWVNLHVRPSGYWYNWTPGNVLNDPGSTDPRGRLKETTEFHVTIRDREVEDEDCYLDTALRVSVLPVICEEPNIFIPNAFTPNDDGNNDVLYVRGNHVYFFHFRVFDRWGEKVFETYDQDKGWDGTYKGREADPAVFVYYLDIMCTNEDKFFKKGNVTLIR